MKCNQVSLSGHAVRRMFERCLSSAEVIEVVRNGEVIAEYLDAEPFPSFLVLGFPAGLPVHAVVGVEERGRRCYIITVYYPSTDVWESDFRTRRRK